MLIHTYITNKDGYTVEHIKYQTSGSTHHSNVKEIMPLATPYQCSYKHKHEYSMTYTIGSLE